MATMQMPQSPEGVAPCPRSLGWRWGRGVLESVCTRAWLQGLGTHILHVSLMACQVHGVLMNSKQGLCLFSLTIL